jgi:poly(A) polymerase/tRNA nucleotidyltransferase (CCA-adding enzyme)
MKISKIALESGYSMENTSIPKEILFAIHTLNTAGFQAYIVGGSIRDLLLHKKPKDWDIATNALPEEIQGLFPHHFYNNKYGTVTIVNDTTTDETLKNIEITPFRAESGYSDRRHPDEVTFTKTIEEDLARRDFTINAIAYDPSQGQLVDPYKGQKDISLKVIRAVGEAKERFEEDALRIIRAARIASELGFEIEENTEAALKGSVGLLNEIAEERIRDEFSRIVLTKEPKKAIELLHKLGILAVIVPEIEEGIGVEQNSAHSYTVFEHNLRALQHASDKDWGFHVKLAALFHDVAKPHTKGWNEVKKDHTFYGHDVVGAKMTKKILTRLKFSRETIDVVTKLVRYHLFFSDTDKVTLSAVRRLLQNVGKDHIWELMNLRACDRIGTGRPKEAPYRLRKYEAMIEEVMRDPITVGMLKIDGKRIMEVSRENPGPRIGFILHALLEEVLENPEKNTVEQLEARTLELAKLSEEELKKLGDLGKEKKAQEEEKEVEEIRKRHWVK